MAEPQLVFRREWAVQVRKRIDDENSVANTDAILRVATPLLKMKPEAYIPQFLSIGLFHHSKLEKDIDSSCAERKISTAEAYKAKSAATLSQKLHICGKSFKSIVEMMEHMRPEIERFYHWPDSTSECEYDKNFALMMAVDSSFLLRFLFSLLRFRSRPRIGCGHCPGCPCSDNDIIRLSPLQLCIKCDIMKLENQIPLFVMRKVFENAEEAFKSDIGRFQDFNQLVQKACLALSPFLRDVSNNNSKLFNEEPHFLGCMHAFVSPFLQMQTEEEEPTLLQRLSQKLKLIFDIPLIALTYFLPTHSSTELKYAIAVNASHLVNAGIKFKSFSELPSKIQFDKYSSTLYLPQIIVSEMQTEVLLRNLVALEFNDATRHNSVMLYVALMNCLIQSPNDVRVLRDRRVILTNTLTDDSISNMWTSLGQPFFTGDCDLGASQELGEMLFQFLMKNYYKSKIKSALWGYVSSWMFIAQLGLFLGFAITALQTYCIFYHF